MSTSAHARQPAGTPAGGQFAVETKTEPATTIAGPGPGPGHPDGPLVAQVFDIDGEFGPLAGYDDGRRWNGFAQPWLTDASLQTLKATTRDWVEVDAEVEWLDDGPDGTWRLHTSGGEPPIPLERAVQPGPGGEALHRLEGWCFSSVVAEDDPSD